MNSRPCWFFLLVVRFLVARPRAEAFVIMQQRHHDHYSHHGRSSSASRMVRQQHLKQPIQCFETKRRPPLGPLPMASSSHNENNEKANENESSSSLFHRLAYVKNPIAQTLIVLIGYVVHLTWFTQRQITFPVQLIPNTHGHFTGLGLDSVAGILSIVAYGVVRRRWRENFKTNPTKDKTVSSSPMPSLLAAPKTNEAPWQLPLGNARTKATATLAALTLVKTYFETGRFSMVWEDILYEMSGRGFAITAPMFRSLLVLLGHLSWLTAGAMVLKWLPRPPRFFGNTKDGNDQNNNNQLQDDKDERSSVDSNNSNNNFQWFRSTRRHTTWAWWVLGGYFASAMLFNVANLVNQYILPAEVLEEAQDSLVSQLVNPEYNDWAASAVGYIAPCLTAPWWEEVLYRGFALPALTLLFGNGSNHGSASAYHWAVYVQGLIFSAHHMSLPAALPLAVLGWTWAIVYTKSRNLWTVICIHMLWNSRVFLGSWLGL